MVIKTQKGPNKLPVGERFRNSWVHLPRSMQIAGEFGRTNAEREQGMVE